jgi:hypothetical protein
VGDVAELKSLSTRPNVILGGNTSLTEAMALFHSLSEDNPRYQYTRVLADHIDLIANVPVRNVSEAIIQALPFFLFLQCNSAQFTVTVEEWRLIEGTGMRQPPHSL